MLKHTSTKPTQYLDDEFLGEINTFADITEPKETAADRQKRKARLDALEDMRHRKSLREQIDYLYDQQFVNLSAPRHAKKSKTKEFE